MLSLRYLRARRKEGFISVIAGFSFLGIMLGVATLIIVMAVMNGFRQELLDKILGLNGHLLIQPLEKPLTDWDAVSDRVSKVTGVRSPHRSSRVRRWRPRRSMRAASWCAASAPPTWRSSLPSPRTSSTARSKNSIRGRALPSAAGSPSSYRCRPATTSRWWRRAARSLRWVQRRASSPIRLPPSSRSACRNTTAPSCSCRCTEAQAYFNRAGDVTAIEIYTDDPDHIDSYRTLVTEAAAAADLHDRLAPA